MLATSKLLNIPSFLFVTRIYSKKPKYILNMNKVYMRHSSPDNQIKINFRYKNNDFNIDREFNFNRNINEKIETCLERIKNNIERECFKTLKKKKKCKKEVVPTNRTLTQLEQHIPVEILQNNLVVRNTTFSELFDSESESPNLVLKILEDNFEIEYNKPWVNSLNLPNCMLSGYFIHPTKMELQFANKEHSIGVWYKGLMPKSKQISDIDWVKIHEGFTYCSQNSDIGYYIKFELIPGKNYVYGPPFEVISKNVVQAGPGNCPFEDRHLFTKEKLFGNDFRIVTYNILADLYADSDYSRKQLFPYCPAHALDIDYRKQLFIKEIIGFNSDIICLQEVDCKIFEHDLIPVFETQNLSGVMEKKGNSGEGVATFYRNDRLDMIKHFGCNIGENIGKLDIFNDLAKKINNNKTLLTRIKERATTLQVSILKFKDSGKYIILANTHLYFHPDADHIRLLQMGFCMLFIENVYEKAILDYKIARDNIAILFCGDLNSTPDCGIYKLMTSKFVDEKCLDWISNKTEAVENVQLSQPFNIESACGLPKYTNYTHLFSGCLDYIYFETNNLQVKQVIPPPSDNELTAHTAIPSVVFPSDHISLAVDLKWKSLFFPKY